MRSQGDSKKEKKRRDFKFARRRSTDASALLILSACPKVKHAVFGRAQTNSACTKEEEFRASEPLNYHRLYSDEREREREREKSALEPPISITTSIIHPSRMQKKEEEGDFTGERKERVRRTDGRRVLCCLPSFSLSSENEISQAHTHTFSGIKFFSFRRPRRESFFFADNTILFSRPQKISSLQHCALNAAMCWPGRSVSAYSAREKERSDVRFLLLSSSS